MAYWVEPGLGFEFPKSVEVVEFFAGKGRIASMAHLMGYEARAADLLYDSPPTGESTHSGLPKRSCFDMCGEAGLVYLLFTWQL